MSFLMWMCEKNDFYYTYIWISLKFIIMKTILSNFIDSSFEHVLHSYGIRLVSTYKYGICKSKHGWGTQKGRLILYSFDPFT
jgi:hypothetical protein